MENFNIIIVSIVAAIEQTDDQLADEIQKAHVICVVYSVEDEDTLDRAASYWLPLVRQCSNNRCPVVLVGNKIDLVDYSTIEVKLHAAQNLRLHFDVTNKITIYLIFCRLSTQSWKNLVK